MSTFDTNRFLQVLKYDLKQTRYTYGKSLLVAVLTPVMCWLLVTLLNGSFNMVSRVIILYMDFMLVLIIAPSRLYARVNQGNKGIYYAMLPASKTEKFLSMWLICAIILPVFMATMLIAVDSLLATLPFGSIQKSVLEHDDITYLWNITDNIQDILGIFLGEYMNSVILMVINAVVSLHMSISYFMLTNTIFKKSKVILSILVMWGISIVFSPMSWMVTLASEGALDWMRDTSADTIITTVTTISAGITALIAIVLYYCTYRRLDKMSY